MQHVLPALPCLALSSRTLSCPRLPCPVLACLSLPFFPPPSPALLPPPRLPDPAAVCRYLKKGSPRQLGITNGLTDASVQAIEATVQRCAEANTLPPPTLLESAQEQAFRSMELGEDFTSFLSAPNRLYRRLLRAAPCYLHKLFLSQAGALHRQVPLPLPLPSSPAD